MQPSVIITKLPVFVRCLVHYTDYTLVYKFQVKLLLFVNQVNMFPIVYAKMVFGTFDLICNKLPAVQYIARQIWINFHIKKTYPFLQFK